jgi:hypothetical protein
VHGRSYLQPKMFDFFEHVLEVGVLPALGGTGGAFLVTLVP